MLRKSWEMPVALRTRMLEGSINILGHHVSQPSVAPKQRTPKYKLRNPLRGRKLWMLFLPQAVHGLLKSFFFFPNIAFFRAVLPRGDGFGGCEACRSVIVHAGGARHAPAQPAQLIAADKDKAETMQSPKQLVFQLAVFMKQFVPEQAAPFKALGHLLKCLMERRRGFPPKRLQIAGGSCAALSPAESPPIKDPSPPSADVLFPGGDQEENFMKIYSLFGVRDSPSITRLLPMAHSLAS